MKRTARLVAGVCVFVFFVGAAERAAHFEVARGSVLSERGVIAASRPEASELAGPASYAASAAAVKGAPAPRSESTCGASSIGPGRPVPTVTSCSESIPLTATRHQKKPLRWWVARARQNKRDSLARGRTIRRLQTVARSRLAYPTGHWLDGAFLCIHRYERGTAGWQTDTGNGYRGGVQMDWSFSNTYGPAWAIAAFGRNPAGWPASVQISAAIHAWTTRGFGPWPSTRRMCGL